MVPWLADRRLFLANGFETVDTAPPDYELMVRKFNGGLTVIRSGQCSHFAKFADDIVKAAEREYHLTPRVVDVMSCEVAQQVPTPYAVFALIYDGQLVADHQISRGRCRNIMNECGV